MNLLDARHRNRAARQSAGVDPLLNCDMGGGLKLQVALVRIVAIVVLERAFDRDLSFRYRHQSEQIRLFEADRSLRGNPSGATGLVMADTGAYLSMPVSVMHMRAAEEREV